MNILFFIFEIAWSITMGLLGIFAAYVAITAVLMGIYWAYAESPAGPYLIGVTVLIIVLSIFRAIHPDPDPKSKE